MPASFINPMAASSSPALSFGDGADGKHVDDGVALGALDDVAGDGGVVVDGRGVGHAADGGESTGGGGARAAFDGLGVFEAGLAQMDVHVDEAGRDDEAGGVEFGGAGGVEILADGGDAAVFDSDVADGVQTAGRVHHAAVANDQFRHCRVNFQGCVRAPPCAPQFHFPLDSG